MAVVANKLNKIPAFPFKHLCRLLQAAFFIRRLEFAGAVYHVTSRGDRQQAIYFNDADRAEWLQILGLICARFNFVVHGYCQMTNHYHLLVETVEGNLSQGMRLLNGLYSRYVNRRHELVGHLFQGRYKAILIQREQYLLAVIRYVALNPVRAGMVSSPDDWRWSSHHLLMHHGRLPEWLNTHWTLGQFGRQGTDPLSAYHQFVLSGAGMPSPISGARHQLVLGDDDFVARYRLASDGLPLQEVARAQRRLTALPLAEYQRQYPERDMAMAQAYGSTAYTMAQIAAHFQVSYRTVSRAVRKSGRCQ